MAVKSGNTMRVSMLTEFGELPWDKDHALALQEEQLVPAVHEGLTVVFDFAGVAFVSQSFAGALVSLLREDLGKTFHRYVEFENTNPVLDSILSLASTF